jgi:hypothetical protein
LRPGDIKLLQHKHIERWTKDNKSYVKIYAQSKVKPSYVYCGVSPVIQDDRRASFKMTRDHEVSGSWGC